MQKIYRALLRLYPAEYQAAFGSEMIQVFTETEASVRKRSTLEIMRFAVREHFGLLRGAFVERACKWGSEGQYITACSLELCGDEIGDLRARLDLLLRSMEAAIAQHDFPKARFYSGEEQAARVRLRQLLDESRVSNNLAAV